MDVYIVESQYQYDGNEILNIFSSVEKALYYVKNEIKDKHYTKYNKLNQKVYTIQDTGAQTIYIWENEHKNHRFVIIKHPIH
jgi:hypothetical protein